MKILFAQSYQRFLDPKEKKRHMPYPPLGTVLAATMARAAGHEVFVLDGMHTTRLDEFDTALASLNPDIVFIYDDEFNYLTKMCLTNMRSAAIHMIHQARTKQVPVFVYSSDATDHKELYLKAGCDGIIIGEGESVMLDILRVGGNIQSEQPLLGLFRQHDTRSENTTRRGLTLDLDSLPAPDFSLVDMKLYQNEWLEYHGYFSINISTSRGCPYHCNWCAKPIYGQIYHVQSPEKTAEEFYRLHELYHADHVWITDDIFGLKPGWLEAFSSALQKWSVHVPYKCLSRADLLLRNNTIPFLQASGCQTVWLGAESGSQKILNAMDKGIQRKQIDQATHALRQHNIHTAYFIQFGYTSESWNDIVETRKMIRQNLPDELGISVSYPLPGTPFFERVNKELKEKKNWSDSDDLDMMFTGTYSKSFYKALHRFVHAEYRLSNILKRRLWRRVVHAGYYCIRYMVYGLFVQTLRVKQTAQAKH